MKQTNYSGFSLLLCSFQPASTLLLALLMSMGMKMLRANCTFSSKVLAVRNKISVFAAKLGYLWTRYSEKATRRSSSPVLFR